MDKDKKTINEFNEEKFNELDRLIHQKGICPEGIFIVFKKGYLLSYKGIISTSYCRYDYDYIKPDSLERGQILDSFSKIEFIINKILQCKLFKDQKETYLLDNLIDRLNLESKIRILKEWGLVDKYLFNKIMQVKKVRNFTAHSRDIKKIPYGKSHLLETNFTRFQNDLIDVWKGLLVIYNQLEPQNQLIDKTIRFIEENGPKTQIQAN